jgi:hypothetical protein
MSTVVAKNVQVGTSGTATDNFTIRQPATPDGTVRIANGNSGTTTDLVTVTSAGNVGIGTSSPGAKLDVNGVIRSNVGLRSITPSGTQSELVVQQTGFAAWSIYNPASGTDLRFYNGSDRMTLDSSGNVGIGAISPSYRLQVNNPTASATADAITVQNSGVTGLGQVAGIRFRYVSAEPAAIRAVLTDTGTGAGALGFFTSSDGSGANLAERARIDSSGNFLVGTTIAAGTGTTIGMASANGPLNICDQNFGNGWTTWSFRYAGTQVGQIVTNTTTVAYNTSSDYRLKNITGPITNSGAYIDSLNPVEGTWKSDGSAFVGLIAHEVQEASRTLVATGVKDGEQMQGMDYSSAEIIANLIAEIKSLRARVAALESN